MSLRKIIVILEQDQLINAGVQSFLAAQDCFEVIELESSEPAQIIQQIERIQPDVIIIDQNNQTIPLGDLLSHFENTPNIRTIALNISNNQIQVCDKRQVQIHQLRRYRFRRMQPSAPGERLRGTLTARSRERR